MCPLLQAIPLTGYHNLFILTTVFVVTAYIITCSAHTLCYQYRRRLELQTPYVTFICYTHIPSN